jgi:hypothetical protein
MSKANAAVDRANSLVDQLTALKKRLTTASRVRTTSTQAEADGVGAAQPASADVSALVATALDAITRVRDDELTRPYPRMGYRQYPRVREEIQSISGAVSRAPMRPTEGETIRMKELATELDQAIGKMDRIQAEQIDRINEMMKSMPFIAVRGGR